jgi:outer membrane protein TolC
LVLQQREDQHHEWDDLQQKVNDAKDRLRLIKELETAQRLKVTAEKTRLQQGRSTTLQMVLFEQDFLNAGVSRIIAGAEILDLVASLRSFSDIAH